MKKACTRGSRISVTFVHRAAKDQCPQSEHGLPYKFIKQTIKPESYLPFTFTMVAFQKV